MQPALKDHPNKAIAKKSVDLEATPSRLAEISGFLIPILLTVLCLAAIWVAFGKAKVVELLSLSFVTFFALGKFVVFVPLIPAEEIDFQITFTPWELAAMVMYMDTMVAVIVMYSVHVLEKIYWIGPMIKRVRQDCRYLLKANKWVFRTSSLFIPLFVAFPVAGTGALSGGLLCGLLGFSRLYSIFLICIGAAFSSFGLALGAILLQARLKEFLAAPAFFYSSIAVLAFILVAFGWKLKRMAARQKAQEEKAS
jgi:uncharacterized membrane protein